MGAQAKPLDPKEADLLMGYVLEHYIKHYQAVMRKLGHARAATQMSITELKTRQSKPAEAEHSEVKAYDGMWEKVIHLFTNSGVSEEELVKIEMILTGMPRMIKKHYEAMLLKDEVLQGLIKELASEKYQSAIKRTKQVQSRPDAMSGLGPSEYDVGHLHKEAFMFKVHTSRG